MKNLRHNAAYVLTLALRFIILLPPVILSVAFQAAGDRLEDACYWMAERLPECSLEGWRK